MSKEKWEQSRQETANKWFAGDIVKAEKVLDALPFSTIPEWEDVENLMAVLADIDK